MGREYCKSLRVEARVYDFKETVRIIFVKRETMYLIWFFLKVLLCKSLLSLLTPHFGLA